MSKVFMKNKSPKEKEDSDEKEKIAIHKRHSELLANTKAGVKRVMEEAATKKFIYYDNVTVNGLCATIESCLTDGLQKRALSLFEDDTNSTSFALLKRLHRTCKDSSETSTNSNSNSRPSNKTSVSITSDTIQSLINRVYLYQEHQQNNGFSTGNDTSDSSSSSRFLFDGFESSGNSNSGGSPNTNKPRSALSFPGPLINLFNKPKPCQANKYLWIKFALVNKSLLPIIEALISKQKNYYEDSSIMANSLASRLFLDLIAGPCMLDYSMVKPSDHIWAEPDAAELLDRHRIHSNINWNSMTTGAGLGSGNWSVSNHSSYDSGMGDWDQTGAGKQNDNFSGLNYTTINSQSPGQPRRLRKMRQLNQVNSYPRSARPNLKIHTLRNSTSLSQSTHHPNSSQGNMIVPQNSRECNNNACHLQSKCLSNCVNSCNNTASSNFVAKEYVESLHQNMRSVLLYGKNNVLVQPKEYLDQMAGYLSLHQINDKLRLKWTPNQLMNYDNNHKTKPNKSETNSDQKTQSNKDNQENSQSINENGMLSKSANLPKVQWDCALSINMENIVYLHCHQRDSTTGTTTNNTNQTQQQQPEHGGKMTLVCQDGVQNPPIYFPPGNHLLSFLVCLENGLAPYAVLEPPLVWVDDEKAFPPQQSILYNHRRSVDSTNSNQSNNSDNQSSVVKETDDSNGFSFFSNFNKPLKLLSRRTSDNSSISIGQDQGQNNKVTNKIRTNSDSSNSADATLPLAGNNEKGGNNFDYVFKIIYNSNLVSPIIPNSSSQGSSNMRSPSNTDSSGHMGSVLTHRNTLSSIEEPHTGEDDSLGNARQSDITSNSVCCSHHHSSSSSVDANSIDQLCCVMRQQILSRAFYGWLQYYKNLKTVRTKFSNLVLPGSLDADVPCDASKGLTADVWSNYLAAAEPELSEIYRLIYYGGVAEEIRQEVWPRLLGHYPWSSTQSEINKIDQYEELQYEKLLSQWRALEIIVNERSNDTTPPQLELTVTNGDNGSSGNMLVRQDEIGFKDESLEGMEKASKKYAQCDMRPSQDLYSSDATTTSYPTEDNGSSQTTATTTPNKRLSTSIHQDDFVFSESQISSMADNLHRIEKDVDRCDRNFIFFKQNSTNGLNNLSKLRKIMVTWVWCNLSTGYVQGMCDLLAPLLVILQKESLTYACFCRLMKRMVHHFPLIGGTQMDESLSTMALLLQITDPTLYEHMCVENEFTSLFVAYRWFLLDFKRELRYSDVFSVWETIWSARKTTSKHFNLFLGLSMLQYYRDIILDNNMEYTDIIKFYNEMAEKHEVSRLLFIARDLIESIRDLLQSKQ